MACSFSSSPILSGCIIPASISARGLGRVPASFPMADRHRSTQRHRTAQSVAAGWRFAVHARDRSGEHRALVPRGVLLSRRALRGLVRGHGRPPHSPCSQVRHHASGAVAKRSIGIRSRRCCRGSTAISRSSRGGLRGCGRRHCRTDRVADASSRLACAAAPRHRDSGVPRQQNSS